MIVGSFFFKSPKIFEIGRGVGSEYGHIHFPITLRCTKTKSEVLGLNMTKFRKNGGVEFFLQEWQPWSQICTFFVLRQFFYS